MIEKVFKILFFAVLSSLPLLLIGYILSRFFAKSTESLGIILFIIGAIPLVLFSPGLFSGSTSGAIHTPKVIYRLVDTLTPHNKRYSNSEDPKSNFNFSLNWVLAGLLLWIVSYFA